MKIASTYWILLCWLNTSSNSAIKGTNSLRGIAKGKDLEQKQKMKKIDVLSILPSEIANGLMHDDTIKYMDYEADKQEKS